MEVNETKNVQTEEVSKPEVATLAKKVERKPVKPTPKVEVKEEVKETPEVEVAETPVVEEPVKADAAEESKDIKAAIEEIVNETVTPVVDQINEVKKQEANILAEIEKNPAGSEKLIKKELERVEKEIQKVEKEISKLNNKVFTTNTWNGWGYGN